MRLAGYLDGNAAESAAQRSNAWIKSLRQARVDGAGFRERFTYRGDSLWWFAELYLHKERAVLSLLRAIAGAHALIDREIPTLVRLDRGDSATRVVLPQVCRQRHVQYEGPAPLSPVRLQDVMLEARSTALMAGAVASPGRARQRGAAGARIAAFVHKAFWRPDGGDGSAESYIGPVLKAIEEKLPPRGIRYIGIGPSMNFRARRWWRRGAAAPEAVQPIEQLVPLTAMAASTGIWAARYAMRRALHGSDDLHAAAIVDGCDCWPVIRDALSGVALLQFPWSARAMDEAGAALDALQPSAALTYAEAGGWGRAIALEARRRRIPLAGLQHGFIYRHWLNYLHEPDEMQPLSPPSPDRGFPHPTLTLVFDDYARRHLIDKGRFPPDSIEVTGSPRLDVLASRFAALADAELAGVKSSAGAAADQALVLLVTKYSESQAVLPALLDAIGGLPQAFLAIKTHPAETPEAYERAAAGMPNVAVLPAAADLAALMRASRAIVTVNSTVALDGLALGVPALTIGEPNNLSPFVSAGVIAGASSDGQIGAALRRVLYDEEFRQQLSAAAGSFVAQYRMRPDGRAADRSAEAVLRMIEASRSGETSPSAVDEE